MTSSHSISFACTRGAIVMAVALALCACSIAGPQSISAGRGLYTEVINRTEDEQLLNMLVRLRYDETFGMLSVASVTANLKFSINARTEIGLGGSDNYEGNLVPLSSGVAYEETPTISYVPLSGEEVMQRLLAPVSAKEWILLAGPAYRPGYVMALAAKRINGLRNTLSPEEAPSADFRRLVELFDQLRRADVLDVAQTTTADGERTYYWAIHGYAGKYHDYAREFLDLLNIEATLDGSEIFLPIRNALGSANGAVHLDTRSAWEVLRVLGAGIEIPSSHLEAGIVEPLEWTMAPGERVLTIRSSRKPPEDATVQVRFRDHWYYVDATDTRSKRSFMFLRIFIALRLANAAADRQAPVLTIPVN